ncbi:hypothetical protein O3P69_012427 [Scylla paramamosain]|uniref:Uncharacterized protein n=1 Tax=Scylla paramamosain TaxID=85552 RepID=A0AAW0SCP6_SCYPA
MPACLSATGQRKCRDWPGRELYATLIVGAVCCVGVGVFCGTVHRGTTLSLCLFGEVFNLHINLAEEMRRLFVMAGEVA